MDTKNKTKVSIDIPDETYERLYRLAKEARLTITAYARWLLLAGISDQTHRLALKETSK